MPDMHGRDKVLHEPSGSGLSTNTPPSDEGSRTELVDAVAARRAMRETQRSLTSPFERGDCVDWASFERVSQDVVVLKNPMSPRAADLRRLAQKLAVQWFLGDDVHSALSIISAERGEGRTTIATNLACVFAQAGARTLLIDADLHHPTVHLMLGLPDIEQDAGGRPIPSCIDNLWVLPASKDFSLDHERFMRSTLSSLVQAQRSHFDLILVDTNAASISDDYLFAALSTGGAVVVTREGVTKVKAAAKMLNRCEDAGVRIVGGTMLEN